MKRRLFLSVFFLAAVVALFGACERKPPQKTAPPQSSGNDAPASTKIVPIPSPSSEKPSAGIVPTGQPGVAPKVVGPAAATSVPAPAKPPETTARAEPVPRPAPVVPATVPRAPASGGTVSGKPLSKGDLEAKNEAPPTSPLPASALANVPAANLSGNWHGAYTVQPANQITAVNVRIEDHTDSLTGTLIFDPGGTSAASCAVSGHYNPQRRFMLLTIGICQGRAPGFLQGTIGFSSVGVTDRRLVGVEMGHNAVMDISR